MKRLISMIFRKFIVKKDIEDYTNLIILHMPLIINFI